MEAQLDAQCRRSEAVGITLFVSDDCLRRNNAPQRIGSYDAPAIHRAVVFAAGRHGLTVEAVHTALCIVVTSVLEAQLCAVFACAGSRLDKKVGRLDTKIPACRQIDGAIAHPLYRAGSSESDESAGLEARITGQEPNLRPRNEMLQALVFQAANPVLQL